MKIIIIIAITAITFATGAIAQTDSTNRKLFPPDIIKTNDGLDLNNGDQNYPKNDESKAKKDRMEKHPDGYMMYNGKMMMVTGGEMFEMEKDATLNNGTIKMANGNYMKKGGIKIMLKEGQHIDLSGNLISMKTKTPND